MNFIVYDMNDERYESKKKKEKMKLKFVVRNTCLDCLECNMYEVKDHQQWKCRGNNSRD